MQFLTKAINKAFATAYYIRNPQYYLLSQKGVLIDIYSKLTQKWFQSLGIATVLDIGANTGQFSTTIMAAFPSAKIYAFEPLPNCFEELQQRFRYATKFEAFNIGLGENSAELVFEHNAYSPSSSFLRMTEIHREAFPFTSNAESVKVQVRRLDEVSNLEIIEPLLVKVDVQGYEMHVLRGGEQTIKRAKVIIIETSFETLYENQPLFDEVYQCLRDWGFKYIGALDQLVNPLTGQILQADSIFLKY